MTRLTEACVVDGCGLTLGMGSNRHLPVSECRVYPEGASGCVEPHMHHPFTPRPAHWPEPCAAYGQDHSRGCPASDTYPLDGGEP